MKKIELGMMGLLLTAASGLAGCEYYDAPYEIRTAQAEPAQKTETVAEKTEGDVIVPEASDDSWRIEKEALEKQIAELIKAVEDAKTPVQPVTPPPASPTPAPTTPTPTPQTPPSTPPAAIIPRQVREIALAPKMAPVAGPVKKLALDGSDRESFWTAEGGDGGERFRAMCGFGEVVVGYKLRSGDVLDRLVAVVCKPLDKLADGDFVEVAVEGGGEDGGELHLVNASEGEAMVGWNAKMGLFSEDAYIVTEFQPLSARVLPEIGIINEAREGDKFGLGADGENTQANRDMTFNRCPVGYVLTGIEGLAGNYVDNLKGLCARVVVKDR